jgi:peroxiredoxin
MAENMQKDSVVSVDGPSIETSVCKLKAKCFAHPISSRSVDFPAEQEIHTRLPQESYAVNSKEVWLTERDSSQINCSSLQTSKGSLCGKRVVCAINEGVARHLIVNVQ